MVRIKEQDFHFPISSLFWISKAVLFFFSGLCNYLKPFGGKSQTILEHCPYWAVGGEFDGCVEVKSSLAPWEGHMAELWVMQCVGDPRVERWGSVSPCKEALGIGGCFAALGSITSHLISSICSLIAWEPALFSHPSLSSLLPQYESFSSLRDGRNGIFGAREVDNPFFCNPIYATLLFNYLQGSGFWNSKAWKRFFSLVFSTGIFLPQEFRMPGSCMRSRG